MLYYTQLIYLKPGKEEAFLRFEELVLPLLAEYQGELLLRVRPDPKAVISGSHESPFEIHLLTFPKESDFESYATDQRRQKWLAMKEESVARVLLVAGQRIL